MEYLKKTFRWFGPSFGVTLEEIKQLGMGGVVTACHQIPTGEVWPIKTITEIKNKIESHGLEWSVVESVNIHNAIKYGHEDRDIYIGNYIETLRNLAKNGIYTICYNFMPLIDWTRTNLNYELPNGAISLLYDPIAIAAFDLFILKRSDATKVYDKDTREKAAVYFEELGEEARTTLEKSILAGLPGSKEPISMDYFKKSLVEVSQLTKQDLQENLAYFLKTIIPEAEKLGVKMAIHPDDPPFSVFGLPRVASTYEDLSYILDSCPSENNGLTFCSGSLGASASNDLPKVVRDFGNKIHFIHLRNVQRHQDGVFYEAAHLKGTVPMAKIMAEIVREQQRRQKEGEKEIAIPLRPDHGHVLLDDKQRKEEFYPGYSLIGRAMGMAELSGLEEGIREVLGTE